MRKRITWFALLMSLVALAAISCSDDDDSSPTGPGDGSDTSVDMSSVQVDIPPAMSTAASNSNAGAATAQAYITQVNSFTAYSSWWTPPSKAAPSSALQEDGNYQWSQGGLTITLETSNSGSAFTWKVWLDGSDGETSYDNFLFVDGMREDSENTGSMSIRNPDSPGSALLFWQWATDPLGVFTVDLSVNDEGFDLNARINPDGSGAISRVDGSVTTFEAAWTTTGAGTYTFRDGSGEVTDSGSWPGV